MIAVIAVVIAGATGAFFSDTETSTGNTFTAGAIDLTVDSTQHYNGNVCVWDPNEGLQGGPLGAWIWSGPVGSYPVPGTYCYGSWALTDLQDGVQKFFNFGDIKPGDEGEDTISLHVLNNDAWVCAEVSNLTSLDNGQTEPELLVDNTGLDGELDSTMLWKVWRDDGDNIQEIGNDSSNSDVDETTLLSGNPTDGVLALYDSTTLNGPLLGGITAYLGVAWTLPAESGNETQTDSLTGDISFRVEQSRNNEGFRCDGQEQDNGSHS